jgi:large subunit ribosomal protein L10
MDRAQKAAAIEWVGGVFDKNSVVVVGNGGLSVKEMTELRGELRQAGANLRVVKNRLARIAIDSRPMKKIGAVFKGPTAIAYAEDPVAAARVIEKFAKKNDKLKILGAALGAETLDANGVKALAAMPSREELIGQIVRALMSPAANLASAIGAPAANIAGILETLEKRDAA